MPGCRRLVELLLIGGLTIVGCGSAPDDPTCEADGRQPPPEALARAREAARALGSELMGTLRAELQAGGPVRAVRVCSEIAQDRSRAFSVEGLRVRRVSLKLRNPADAPDAFERGVLEELEASHARGELPEEVIEVVEDGGSSSLRYMRPIRIVQPCLSCHGDPQAIDPEVRRLLQELYPADQATGYGLGDLRGAVSVSVALK
jgi:hypothetical protein